MYEDYRREQLGKGEVMEILGLVESYLFRRAICDLQTQGLNKIFAGLMGRIDKEDYLQSLKINLSALIGTQRFPSDNVFRREFLTKDVYNLRVRNYLLRKLENHNRKERIRVDDYTIEHVMPQTLTDEWREELGENWNEVHAKYLHTMGNLTLTGYNTDLSNKTLIEKQLAEGGFLDSPLRLNQSLRQAERWDEKAIVNRAEILVAKACEIWPHHGISYQSQQEAEWTLADHPYFTNEWNKLFLPLQKSILDLHSTVNERINRYYISFRKNDTSFVELHGTKKQIGFYLRIQTATLNDPRKLCQANRKTYGGAAWQTWLGIATVENRTKFKYLHHFNSVAELAQISVEDEVEYIMYLIRQVFDQV